MKSALEQSRQMSTLGKSLFELCRAINRAQAQTYIVPADRPCDCCGDKYPEDELVKNRLNGRICQACVEFVAEFDPLDQD